MTWNEANDSSTSWDTLTEISYLLCEDGVKLIQEDGWSCLLLEESRWNIWTDNSDAVTVWT